MDPRLQWSPEDTGRPLHLVLSTSTGDETLEIRPAGDEDEARDLKPLRLTERL